MKKRLFTLIGILVLGLVGCGSEGVTNNDVQSIVADKEEQISEEVSLYTWDDYSVVIDSIVLDSPTVFEQFISKGLSSEVYSGEILNNMMNTEIPSGDISSTWGAFRHLVFTNNITNNIDLIFYNPTTDSLLLKDCYVIGFKFTKPNNWTEQKLGEVKIINNSKNTEAIIGSTKIEDIESLFGEPYEINGLNSEPCYTYYNDLNKDGELDMFGEMLAYKLSFVFDGETGILKDIEYRNIENLEFIVN